MAEGEILDDACGIGFMDEAVLGEVPLALGTLRGEQVPAGGVREQNLAGASDFESLGDGFFGLAAGNRFRHGREEGREARGKGKQNWSRIADC